ncbi:hypothetical protein [Microcoleus sp. FACHB-672]|uniref:hypothetical protein n=1 Tax=Microcoleus sp. FACHB-672 TaxID=2692825 RepID=UPI0016880F9B|nr:hypothetical protein [Microcoleus sp. FACHB-672]MBD2041843.1 hypothetical protein [Microcoleus sp. FACHB-672]
MGYRRTLLCGESSPIIYVPASVEWQHQSALWGVLIAQAQFAILHAGRRIPPSYFFCQD